MQAIVKIVSATVVRPAHGMDHKKEHVMHKQGMTTMTAIEDMEIEMMNEVMRDKVMVSRAQMRIRAEHPNFRHWWKDEDVTKGK